jgi:hypothetical protein
MGRRKSGEKDWIEGTGEELPESVIEVGCGLSGTEATLILSKQTK